MRTVVLYDVLHSKPKHGHVQWVDGTWSELQDHVQSCKERGCLLLLSVEPQTKKQTYQHGDPGPILEIDPNKGEFSRLNAWLDTCHAREDAQEDGRQEAPASPQRTGARGLGKLFFWKRSG